jgi:hypothetical protein
MAAFIAAARQSKAVSRGQHAIARSNAFPEEPSERGRGNKAEGTNSAESTGLAQGDCNKLASSARGAGLKHLHP